MRKALLLKLADFLATKVPRQRFCMGSFFDEGFEKDICGTKACACGWATVAFPRSKFKIVESLSTWNKEVSENHLQYEDNDGVIYKYFKAAAKFFDIPLKYANELFDPYNDYHLNATPKQQAKIIRQFVKNHTNEKITYYTVVE